MTGSRDRRWGPTRHRGSSFFQGGDKQPHLSQLSRRLDLSPTTTTTQTEMVEQRQAHRKMQRHRVVLWRKLWEGDEQQRSTG